MTKEQATRVAPLAGYYTVTFLTSGGKLLKPGPMPVWIRVVWAVLALGVFPWFLYRLSQRQLK